MAKIIVRDAVAQGGVRSIQGVEKRMANRMMDALVREKQSIKPGAHVRYSSSEEYQKMQYSVEKFGTHETSKTEEENWKNADDIFG